jgi:hypothetical protein
MMTVAVQPQLGGRLRLLFGPETDFAAITGATIDLFDWPGELGPNNRFALIQTPAGSQWDLSRIYTTGEVTLLVIPEPSALALCACGATAVGLIAWRLRRLLYA